MKYFVSYRLHGDEKQGFGNCTVQSDLRNSKNIEKVTHLIEEDIRKREKDQSIGVVILNWKELDD